MNTNDIVFAGNSHTQFFDVEEYFKGKQIKNRGVGGEMSSDLLNRLNQILPGKPQKIFIEIGFNDIVNKINPDTTVKNLKLIISQIALESPKTKIYMTNIFPSSVVINNVSVKNLVKELNTKLAEAALASRVTFIDVNSKLNDGDDGLNPDYDAGDGIHLSGNGYQVYADVIKKYL